MSKHLKFKKYITQEEKEDDECLSPCVILNRMDIGDKSL